MRRQTSSSVITIPYQVVKITSFWERWGPDGYEEQTYNSQDTLIRRVICSGQEIPLYLCSKGTETGKRTHGKYQQCRHARL